MCCAPLTSPSVINTTMRRRWAASGRGTDSITAEQPATWTSSRAAFIAMVASVPPRAVIAEIKASAACRFWSLNGTGRRASASRLESKAMMLKRSDGPRARRQPRTARWAAAIGLPLIEPERSTSSVTVRGIVGPSSANAGGISATEVVAPRPSGPSPDW